MSFDKFIDQLFLLVLAGNHSLTASLDDPSVLTARRHWIEGTQAKLTLWKTRTGRTLEIQMTGTHPKYSWIRLQDMNKLKDSTWLFFVLTELAKQKTQNSTLSNKMV